MPQLPTIETLDPDAMAEYLAEQEYLTEAHGHKIDFTTLEIEQTPEERQ